MKKILNLLSGHASYDAIRIVDPLNKIRTKLKTDNITVTLLPMSSASIDICNQFDRICVHGCPSLAFYPILKKIPFVMFVDDLMTALEPSNPAMVDKELIRGLNWCHDNAKSIICTTQALKDTFERDNVFIAPNLMDIDPVTNISENICYAGGNSHTADMELLNGLETKRTIYFFTHTLPSGYCHYRRNKRGIVELFTNKENIKYIPLQLDYERYGCWMNNLKYGVGLVPLESNKFNEMKSIMKVGEYLKQGAISVISPVGALNEIPKECVVMVQDNNWDSAITTAFNNRETIYHACWNWWDKNYSYRKNEGSWINAYKNM